MHHFHHLWENGLHVSSHEWAYKDSLFVATSQEAYYATLLCVFSVRCPAAAVFGSRLGKCLVRALSIWQWEHTHNILVLLELWTFYRSSITSRFHIGWCVHSLLMHLRRISRSPSGTITMHSSTQIGTCCNQLSAISASVYTRFVLLILCVFVTSRYAFRNPRLFLSRRLKLKRLARWLLAMCG